MIICVTPASLSSARNSTRTDLSSPDFIDNSDNNLLKPPGPPKIKSTVRIKVDESDKLDEDSKDESNGIFAQAKSSFFNICAVIFIMIIIIGIRYAINNFL